MINVMLVDDEKLITNGLKIILDTYEDIHVTALASNGKEALSLCRTCEPDVILMDVRMPVCDGVLGTKLIKNEFKKVKILILTTFNDVEYIHDALLNGASGYILKDSDYDLIYESIKACIKGNVVVHPDVISKIMDGDKKESENKVKELMDKFELNQKEINIIKEVANGLTNKEIGEKLFLSEGTIKNNISNILFKLSLRDRTQLTIFAFKNNIIQNE